MDSDVKISPMGYWVISLYKSNKITNTISLKTFDGLNEDVLKPVHVQMLSNRVYEKCLVYTQRYNEWELTVEQTKIAKRIMYTKYIIALYPFPASKFVVKCNKY